jgi:hypothetical protein
LDHVGDVTSFCNDYTLVNLEGVGPGELDENKKSLPQEKLWEKNIEQYLELVNELAANLR